MPKAHKLLLGVLVVMTSLAQGKNFERLLEVNTAAESWIVQGTRPSFYTSLSDQYLIKGNSFTALNAFGDDIGIDLSPNGDYSVLSSLQPLQGVKQSRRDGTFSVLDRNGNLEYQVIRSTPDDLKPLVAAVSDTGVLVLADPVKAMIYIYEAGNLISEGQLFSTEADYSMERSLEISWVGEEIYILLERPAPMQNAARKVLFFIVSADGREQRTHVLPFAHLQDHIFTEDHIIVSGYDHDPTTSSMSPQIIELDPAGKLLWSNLFFGHELAISSNHRYLAARSSHELIHVFDLDTKAVNRLGYAHENKASLGLSVNDRGEVAIIRVALDFFSKQNTFFTQIYFPVAQKAYELQLNPRSYGLFQTYSTGNRFFIGTSYEWLEITQ